MRSSGREPVNLDRARHPVSREDWQRLQREVDMLRDLVEELSRRVSALEEEVEGGPVRR